MGTRKDFLYNGTTGNTVADNTTATPTNTGANSPITINTGGSAIHKTAAKHPGSPLGIRVTGSTAGACIVDEAPDASSKIMSWCWAFTVPSVVPNAAAKVYTIKSIRNGANAIKLNWTNAGALGSGNGHLTVTKLTGTTHDLGAFTPGTKLVWRGRAIAGAGTTDGELHFELLPEGSLTPVSGTTVDIVPTGGTGGSGGHDGGTGGADIGTAAFDTGRQGFTAGLDAADAGMYLDYGPSSYQSGLTSFLAPLVDAAAGADSGVIPSIVDPGAWTAPTGTILANLTDTSTSTVARSPIATSTIQWLKADLATVGAPMNPKPAFTVPIPNGKSPGVTGDGIVTVVLMDGATERNRQTFLSSAVGGLPQDVTFNSTVCAAITKDGNNLWSDLDIWVGVSV